MWKSVAAICIGASFGALLRWWFGAQLNNLFPAVPPGTLAANLIGGYISGIAIAFFASYTAIAPEWRLLVITGFSAEIVTLLQQGRSLWAFGAAASHLCGSVVMTLAGIGTVNLIKG
jgi:CrcB protein